MPRSFESPTLSPSASIFTASYEGSLAVVKSVVESEGPEVAVSKDEDGRQPLHWACLGGRLLVVEFLVDQLQAPVDTGDEVCGSDRNLTRMD